MKRQPWFWPVKLFLKRIGGKELWLKSEVEYHHRFPGIGKRRTAESIAALRDLGYRIFGISETGREVCFVLES
jgi:hypothetical protein